MWTLLGIVPLRSSIRRLFDVFGYGLQFLVYSLSVLVPRDDSLWLFTAGTGSRFAENTKYLFLHCEDKSDVRNVWLTTEESLAEALRAEGYEAYRASSGRGRLLALRAGVFFRSHDPVLPELSGRARLVQLSHGNYPKETGYDNDNPRYDSKLEELAGELLINRRTRYVVSSMGPPAAVVESAFRIPRERMLETGFPRTDIFYRDVPNARIGIDTGELERVQETGTAIFYAPTWREAFDDTDGIPLEELDLGFQSLNDLLDDRDAHLFVAPHPESSLDTDMEELTNVSLLQTGGDIYPFLEYCDVLVTDYSGIFYDYLLLDRPIVFFAPDMEAFLSSRGLYHEYPDEMPGPVVTTTDEYTRLVRGVLEGRDDWEQSRANMRDTYYSYQDGASAERVYNAVRGC